MSGLPERAGVSLLADDLGMNRGRVSQLLRAAKLRKDAAGRYDAKAAVEILQASLDTATATGIALAGRGADAGGNEQINSLASAKAAAEKLRAEKLRLEIEKTQGKLIDRAAVEQAARDIGAHIRLGLSGVASKVAPLVVGKNADEAFAVIDEAIHDALAKTADLDSYLLGDLQ